MLVYYFKDCVEIGLTSQGKDSTSKFSWALGTARGRKSQMPSSTFLNVEKRSSR